MEEKTKADAPPPEAIESAVESTSLMNTDPKSPDGVTTTQPKPLSDDDVVSEGVGDDSVRPPPVPEEMKDCGCCCKCCVICLTLTCRNIGLCITNCKDCSLSIGNLFNFSIEGRDEAVVLNDAPPSPPPTNGESHPPSAEVDAPSEEKSAATNGKSED